MEKQKCPEVRFKGFDRDWGAKSLSELGEIQTGSTPSTTEDSNYSKLGLLWVTPTDINSQLILNSGKKLSIIGREKARIVPANTILVTCIASIGKNGLLQEEASFNQQINSLTPYVGNEPYFLLSQSYFWSERMKQFAAKGTMQIVNKTQFSNIQTFIPELAEQTQIGNFFQNLDQSIALQEKKLVQTQNLKKAMLEKMFPKAGSKQPEIRLKGFSGNWDTINLESLCSIGDIDHRMPESTKSGIPYLMTGDFLGINELDFENAKLISNEDYEQLSKKIKPEIGDILFARYASVGTVRLVVTDMKFLISYSCAILKTSVNSNGEYLFYWFQTAFAQNQIEQEINTGSQRNIGIDSLKKLSVSLPKANEQKAIANFFKQLDETLVLQQQQLQTLKNLKQAFLEKMFV